VDLGVLEAGGQVDNRYLVLQAATTLYGGQLLDVHLGAVPTYGQGRLTFGPHRPELGKVKPLEHQVDVAGIAAGMSGLKFVGDAHLAMVAGEWVLPVGWHGLLKLFADTSPDRARGAAGILNLLPPNPLGNGLAGGAELTGQRGLAMLAGSVQSLYLLALLGRQPGVLMDSHKNDRTTILLI
jgi:hypothetical protein